MPTSDALAPDDQTARASDGVVIAEPAESIGPDLAAARSYIESLTGSPETAMTFQTFDDTEMKRGDVARIHHGTIDELAVTLWSANQRRAGVFVTVNETDLRGRSRENIVALRALFVDFDGEARPPALPPSFIVQSARGPHYYWTLAAGEDRARFTYAQKHLAAFYGSDPQVCDLSRVMRLPGFDHNKSKPPFHVTLTPGSGRAFTVSELLAAHPVNRAAERPATPVTSRSDDQPIIAGGRDNALTSVGGAMRRKGASEEEIFAALTVRNAERCRPPLPESDVRRIARSVSRYEPEDDDATPLRIGGTKPAAPRFWSLADLWRAAVPPVEGFLAEQILARQTVNMLAARRGTGKTYLALWFAHCVARGEFFGHLKTRKGRVLILSQEMAVAQIVGRTRKLWSAEDADAFERNVQIACKLPIKADSDFGADQLRQTIEDAGSPDMVIIDALRDIKGSAAEDSNDDMGALFGRLRDRVAVPTNSCLLVIHHKGKPSDAGTERGGRGASAIEDVCADVIYLDTRKGGAKVGTFPKVRDGDAAGQFTFKFEDAEWPDKSRRVVVTIEAGTAEEDEEARLARKVADYVGERGEVLLDEVAKHFNWERAGTDRKLKLAERKGWICRDPERKGGKTGTANLWVPAYAAVGEGS